MPPTMIPSSARGRLAAGLFVLAALCACGNDEEPAAGAPSLEVQRARERAAAWFAQDNRGEALAALQPLLDAPQPAPEDLVRGAIVMRTMGRADEARALLERARQAAPDDPAVLYNLGQLALDDGDFAAAAGFFERVHALDPGDVPTRLALGQALEDADSARADALYAGILDEGFDQIGSFYLTALYRRAQLLSRADQLEEAEPLFEEFQRLTERGFKVPTAQQVARGFYGNLEQPPHQGNPVPAPGPLPGFDPPQTVVPELAGARALELADLDNDGELDVLARGPFGLVAALQAPDRTWSVVALDASAPDEPCATVAFDLENDDDLDVLAARGAELMLYRALLNEVPGDARKTIAWQAGESVATLAAPPAAVVAVDYDHDGDLDLVLAGPFGARVLRNDGGALTDATNESGLAGRGSLAWVVYEDFDTDQDVDLLFGSAAETFLAKNARGGRFEDGSEVLAGVAASALAPVVLDANGDARPDLFWRPPSGGLEVWTQLPSGRFERSSRVDLEAERLATADLDLDGQSDLVALRGNLPAAALQAPGTGAQRLVPLSLPPAETTATARLADLDADLAWEVVAPTPGGLAVWNAEPSAGAGILLSLRGKKDNRRGVGATVELRAGPVYQRHFWTGRNELLGAGSAQALDWLLITWPNGVLQYDPRLDLGDRRVTNDPLEAFLQTEGLVGSCPFLYTWNGSTYEFISDVIGTTPLGLPMAPGQLVPPNHEEFVLVRGDQLAPRDGTYEIQLTEELREVSYFDRVRLDAVDHPAETRVYPNERFTFPPFPEHRIWSVRETLAPVRAADGQGRDWTRELSAVDGLHAVPFERAPSQYQGLATPHVLELEFDRAAVAAAPRLRLVLTGWLYWSNASVNVASARDPAWGFVPPILSVPDGKGGWTETGPPIGFPAGKTKTMVIDVTDLVRRDDPRLRLFSSIQLYWDAILLATDSGDDPVRVTSVEPEGARLWRRGFSAPLADERPDQPARFDWDVLAEHPRWNPHPGLYTRLGECAELVRAVDDRFVVMGSGEALTVRFPARALPPVPPGYRRDWLVYLDGWAKDRDPNSVEALYVEPLPFHGMSGYPYGPDESFPDTPELRAWRREWLVRPAQPWITEGPRHRF